MAEQSNSFDNLLRKANEGFGVTHTMIREAGFKIKDGKVTSPEGKQYELVDEEYMGFGLHDPFFYKLKPVSQSGGKKTSKRKSKKSKKSKSIRRRTSKKSNKSKRSKQGRKKRKSRRR